QPIQSGSDGTAQFSFPKVDEGNYEIVVQGTDSRGNVVTVRQAVSVGQKQYRSNQPQYTVSLAPQKSSYTVGETANVTATANFPMSDVVAVVTGGGGSTILSFSKNSVGNTTWTLPIPIKPEYGQGVGVHIYTVTNGVVVGGDTEISI